MNSGTFWDYGTSMCDGIRKTQEGGEEVFKLDEDYFSAEHSSHITSSYYPEKLIMLACKKTEQPNRVLKLLRASLTNLTKQVSRSSG